MTVYKIAVVGNYDDKSILLLDENPKKVMIQLGVFGMKIICLKKWFHFYFKKEI